MMRKKEHSWIGKIIYFIEVAQESMEQVRSRLNQARDNLQKVQEAITRTHQTPVFEFKSSWRRVKLVSPGLSQSWENSTRRWFHIWARVEMKSLSKTKSCWPTWARGSSTCQHQGVAMVRPHPMAQASLLPVPTMSQKNLWVNLTSLSLMVAKRKSQSLDRTVTPPHPSYIQT